MQAVHASGSRRTHSNICLIFSCSSSPPSPLSMLMPVCIDWFACARAPKYPPASVFEKYCSQRLCTVSGLALYSDCIPHKSISSPVMSPFHVHSSSLCRFFSPLLFMRSSAYLSNSATICCSTTCSSSCACSSTSATANARSTSCSRRDRRMGLIRRPFSL